MKTLQQIWDELPLKTDKGDIHSYLSVYEEILAPYRAAGGSVLEIGIFNGASLLLWEKYFSGQVYGIDCSDQPHGGLADLRPLINEDGHNIIIMDAENPADVENMVTGKFSIIIEDAGHHLSQQLKMYDVWKHYLEENSLYIIEDIQDVDGTREIFEKIDPEKQVTIIDRRHINGRYDDCLVVISNKK